MDNKHLHIPTNLITPHHPSPHFDPLTRTTHYARSTHYFTLHHMSSIRHSTPHIHHSFPFTPFPSLLSLHCFPFIPSTSFFTSLPLYLLFHPIHFFPSPFFYFFPPQGADGTVRVWILESPSLASSFAPEGCNMNNTGTSSAPLSLGDVLNCTLVCCTVLCCIGRYCTLLCCTVLHYTALYCTARTCYVVSSAFTGVQHLQRPENRAATNGNYFTSPSLTMKQSHLLI